MNTSIIQAVSKILLLGATALSISACSTAPSAQPRVSQLELRQIQTRTYDDVSSLTVMKAAIGTLQDMGYTIVSTDKDLGLVTAKKEYQKEGYCEGFNTTYQCQRSIKSEATVTINTFGSNVKIRISATTLGISNKGSIMWTRRVTVPTPYKNFFIKVDKAIFLQIENL